MKFIEPLKTKEKLKVYLDTGKYKSVAIFFGHGLGDCIMFQVIFDKLKELYPDIQFKMALQGGLDEETIYPDAIFANSREEAQKLDYDLVAQINFPVEIDPKLTKMELCCRDELGIEPVSGHKKLPAFPSPLVAVHYNLTCLPGLANPSRDIAEKVWNEIKEAGMIPIETHFSHVFDNPENKIFDFVDCSVRKCQAKISSLLGLLKISRAFIGVVSGPFHCAVSILSPNQILYLEKDIPLERFTHLPIAKADIKNYKEGTVYQFLTKLKI